MNKTEFSKLMAKYAIVLVVSYIIQHSIDLANSYIFEFELLYKLPSFLIPSFTVLTLILLNIIIAMLVGLDIKKYKIETKYIVLMTILWRPLGVCLFLISASNKSLTIEK